MKSGAIIYTEILLVMIQQRGVQSVTLSFYYYFFFLSLQCDIRNVDAGCFHVNDFSREIGLLREPISLVKNWV